MIYFSIKAQGFTQLRVLKSINEQMTTPWVYVEIVGKSFSKAALGVGTKKYLNEHVKKV